MSARTRLTDNCHASVAAQMRPFVNNAADDDMIQSPFGGEPIAPEDAFTRVDVSERIAALAAAEWWYSDERGQLPDNWDEIKAEIERRFV